MHRHHIPHPCMATFHDCPVSGYFFQLGALLPITFCSARIFLLPLTCNKVRSNPPAWFFLCTSLFLFFLFRGSSCLVVSLFNGRREWTPALYQWEGDPASFSKANSVFVLFVPMRYGPLACLTSLFFSFDELTIMYPCLGIRLGCLCRVHPCSVSAVEIHYV